MVVLWTLVVLRFLQGVSQAPVYPITSGAVVPSWFPSSRWAVPNSLQTAALTIGGAAAGPLVTWLVIAVGWRRSFLVCAPLAFATAAVWWWYARDEPEEHPGVNTAELHLIRAERGGGPASDGGTSGVDWKRLLLTRDLPLLTLSYFFTNYVFYLFFNWFFFYLTDVRHLPAQAGGWFVGAQWLVGTVAAVIGGVVCDRISRRRGVRLGCRITSIVALLMAAPLLLAGSLVAHPVLAVVLLSLSFGCVQATDAAFWVAAMTMAGKQAPAATAVLNTGGNLMGALGAVLVPLVSAAFGWEAAIGSGAVAAIVAAFIWIWIRADAPVTAREDAVATDALPEPAT
jgi:MFS transporter, ACS family, glucarate transporter